MEQDIGERVINKLEELDAILNKTYNSALKKNSHLHVMIETDILEKMKKRAGKENLTLSEWCRQKLREDSQLDRIENKMDKLIK